MRISILVLSLAGASVTASANAQVVDSTARARARDSVLLVQLKATQDAYNRALLAARAQGLTADRMSASLDDAIRVRQSYEDARTVELFANRAITKKELDSRLGLLRADSVIRLLADDSRADMRRELELRGTTRETYEAGDSRAFMRLPTASLGMGLVCSDCTTSVVNGATLWTFRSNPQVGAVERGSVAERMGLQRGDTLRTIDDISLTTRQGGERLLGAIQPGRVVKLGWSRQGVAYTASVAMPRVPDTTNREPVRLSESVGNARVEVRGDNATWARDPVTGALRITAGGVTITVIPPG